MRIIFDTDAAVDDIIALIYILTQPNVILGGITVAGTGEAHGEAGAYNLANLCFMLNRGHIPIAYGLSRPRDENATPFPGFLRQLVDTIFDDPEKKVPRHPHPRITDNAVALLHDLLSKSPEKVTILATGPLTNIADLIEDHPELKDNIEKIVIMGGAVDVAGNIRGLIPNSTNHVAEWNIYADPIAADMVFNSGIPITLVPLDPAESVPITEEFCERLSTRREPVLRLIHLLNKSLVEAVGKETSHEKYRLWDPLAAMICLNPDLADIERTRINIKLSDAKTERSTKESAPFIDLVTKVKNPTQILDKMISDIQRGLLDAPRSASHKAVRHYSPYRKIISKHKHIEKRTRIDGDGRKHVHKHTRLFKRKSGMHHYDRPPPSLSRP